MTPRRVEELLSSYPPEIAELSFALRDLVHDTLPFAKEKVIDGWRIVAFSKRNIFLYLAPSSDRVALGFTMGNKLADPAHLLVRLGKAMHSRNVLLQPKTEIPVNALRSMLLEAYERAR